MSRNDAVDNGAVDEAAAGQPNRVPDNLSLVIRMVPLLLEDLCLTRFGALVQAGVDPLEAAQHALDKLSRYDFLNDLELPGTSYPELRKQLENTVSTEAERIIGNQNPR